MVILLIFFCCQVCLILASPAMQRKSFKGRRVPRERLPDKVQELVEEICRGVAARPDFLHYRRKYCVAFHNGELWFNEVGELIRAKYLFTKLPEILSCMIPRNIGQVVGQLSSVYICGFSKDKNGYTVYVFGDMDDELYFDTDGNLRQYMDGESLLEVKRS